jgi:hypothetical protein
MNLSHGKVLHVVAEKWYPVCQSDARDGHIGIGKSVAFLLPQPFQVPCVPGDFGSDRQVFQGAEKDFGFGLFTAPEAGINFSEVHWTTGKDMPLFQQLLEKFCPAQTPVQVVEDYGRIEEDDGHLGSLVAANGVFEAFVFF